MTRETRRQIARLRALARYIKANPKDFDQGSTTSCLIGLGARFYKGKIVREKGMALSRIVIKRLFSQKYGISIETIEHLFWGNYKAVNGNFKKDYKTGWTGAPIPTRSVCRMLEYLASQKEKGKDV